MTAARNDIQFHDYWAHLILHYSTNTRHRNKTKSIAFSMISINLIGLCRAFLFRRGRVVSGIVYFCLSRLLPVVSLIANWFFSVDSFYKWANVSLIITDYSLAKKLFSIGYAKRDSKSQDELDTIDDFLPLTSLLPYNFPIDNLNMFYNIFYKNMKLFVFGISTSSIDAHFIRLFQW